MKERLYLFDTTLRDGAQTNGVDFTLADKVAIAQMLDAFGLDYIEGGYPGANPTDTQLFAEKRRLNARFTAFGMTRRPGRSVSNDPGIAALLEAEADAICFVAEVAKKIPGDHVGIHAHNDTEQAVANSLAAVRAGARQIQGTINGLGERCGNANLVTSIPTLKLKPEFAEKFEIGISDGKLKNLAHLSHTLDEMLNRAPDRHAPYVGESAFATKAGIHASAIVKEPATYEHIDPETVGNRRRLLVSDQSGRSNLLAELERIGIAIGKEDVRLGRLLDEVKEREALGYAYEAADASFELLARDMLGTVPKYFTVEQFDVNVERRFNALGKPVTVAMAVVKVKVDGETLISAAEGNGPVNALDLALRQDLGKYQRYIEGLKLTDYRVRILNA